MSVNYCSRKCPLSLTEKEKTKIWNNISGFFQKIIYIKNWVSSTTHEEIQKCLDILGVIQTKIDNDIFLDYSVCLPPDQLWIESFQYNNKYVFQLIPVWHVGSILHIPKEINNCVMFDESEFVEYIEMTYGFNVSECSRNSYYEEIEEKRRDIKCPYSTKKEKEENCNCLFPF